MPIKRTDIPVAQVFRFLRYLWDRWNIEAAVLASLAFQIVLVLFASSRKRTRDNSKILTLWFIYLLADYVATFAIGLINNASTMPSKPTTEKVAPSPETSCTSNGGHPKHIAAFWAPFLLLHLGGPDTITAFAIEDNELWHRHMLTLIVQLLSVLLVFYRYQILDSPFLVPTVLISVAGLIKYVERTRSLNLACLSNMKRSMRQNPDPGPDYAQLMEEMSSKQDAHLPVKIEIGREKVSKGDTKEREDKLKDTEVVEHGYKFYKTFRGLIVDHMFSFVERDDSRNFFLSLKHNEDAFRVMEVELNFIYDAMFTKMIAVQGNFFGYAFRFACTVLIVAVTVIFVVQHKTSVTHRDLVVTYFLLFGAIFLDGVALLELFFSEWIVALILSKEDWIRRRRWLKTCVEWMNKVRKLISFRMRWSGEISQYSLIKHSLKKRWKFVDEILGFFGLKELIDACLYSTAEPVGNNLRKLIFDEVKKKGKQATQTRVAKEIYLSRGEWTLLDYTCGPTILATVGQDVEFDQSVLMWHIATEICYFELKEDNDPDENREICRFISEYLVYLLVMERKLTTALAGIVEIRFRDTCEEASKFFTRQQSSLKRKEQPKGICGKAKEMCHRANKRCTIYLKSMLVSTWEDIKHIVMLKFCKKNGTTREVTLYEKWKRDKEENKRKWACEELVKVNPQVKPSEVKGDRSKSLLFDACMLAKDLKDLCSNENKDVEDPALKKYSVKEVWLMMSRVWVELLSYGASHCRGDAHAQRLSKGGELLTFVWLLMAHFGLGDQFRIEAGHARAKLIVGKDFSTQ